MNLLVSIHNKVFDMVERNVAAFRHPIPADLWSELKHEGLVRADAPVPA